MESAESPAPLDAPAFGLRPSPPMRGSFRPLGSKSLAQRALLIASLTRGRTSIEALPEGEDVLAAKALVATAGATVVSGPSGVAIDGLAPRGGGWRAREALRLGESGTLARFTTAAAALCGAPGARFRLEPRGTLRQRASAPLFAALRRAGAVCAHLGVDNGWPVEIVAAERCPESVLLVEPVSSQEVSALLLALAAHDKSTRLLVRGEIPSRPYLDMTVALVRRFGARVEIESASEGESVLEIRGPFVAPPAKLAIEPDASSAAVVLAAACVTDGELRVPGLGRDSLQGDVRIVEHLAAFGCVTRADSDGLVAGGLPAHGAKLDLSGEPDLAPVLAAVAAGVALRAAPDAPHASSILSGLSTLPRKESDRLGGLARALALAGCEVESGTGFLRIARSRSEGSVRGPLVLDAGGDHRMVFAFALLGLVREGVLIRDARSVTKSWPAFWSDMRELGARVSDGAG